MGQAAALRSADRSGVPAVDRYRAAVRRHRSGARVVVAIRPAAGCSCAAGRVDRVAKMAPPGAHRTTRRGLDHRHRHSGAGRTARVRRVAERPRASSRPAPARGDHRRTVGRPGRHHRRAATGYDGGRSSRRYLHVVRRRVFGSLSGRRHTRRPTVGGPRQPDHHRSRNTVAGRPTAARARHDRPRRTAAGSQRGTDRGAAGGAATGPRCLLAFSRPRYRRPAYQHRADRSDYRPG